MSRIPQDAQYPRQCMMAITVEQHRALKMLADASTRGCAEAVLRAQGFDAAMLGELINAGLVSRRRALGRYRETADYESGPGSDLVSSAQRCHDGAHQAATQSDHGAAKCWRHTENYC